VHSLEHIKEQAQAALAIVNKILEFGPRVPEFTAHIQAGVEEFRLAGAMVGLAGEGDLHVTCEFEDLVKECPELKTKCEAVAKQVGLSAGDNKGPFMDRLMSLLSNPAVMTLLMSFLKIKLPSP
jgi:hypothetical protein